MNIESYQKTINDFLQSLQADELTDHLRFLCRTDLYFLLRYGLHRPDVENQWIFERCREVQNDPNERLDLWAREHYKSTIITYALTIQEILASHGDNPTLPQELHFAIFSHIRPIAKKFLRQIKFELETNKDLKNWFPDVLYQEPERQSPVWSLDAGIIVKRKGNPKEATIEAWGLVDGQPTSAHFPRLIYDDVVTKASVTTPEMIQKTTEATELSYNLGTQDGVRRFIGTRYHMNDTYKTLIDRKTAVPRIYPATKDGTELGEPVLMSRELLDRKRRDMGPYTFACQMLQNPVADKSQGFREDWLRFYNEVNPRNHNIYIIVDPANEKKKTSDYTAMGVISLGEDQNAYLLDGIYDRLNLTERTRTLIFLHRKWSKVRRITAVGYEKYGKDSDIQHIEAEMEREGYRFPIRELGGSMAKNDRIRRLVPWFEQGRFYLPVSLHKTNYEKKTTDIIDQFRNEEYLPFPVGMHDDFLDMLARIEDDDMGAAFPRPVRERREPMVTIC